MLFMDPKFSPMHTNVIFTQIIFMKKIKRAVLAAALAMLLYTASVSVIYTHKTFAKEFPPTLISVQYGKIIDGGIQKAELYGTYENKSLFARDITIVIKNPETDKEITRISPKTNAGYSPAVTLADFTGDGLKDIYLGIDSGGSGAFGYYYVYSLPDGNVNTIFDYETLKNDYEAKYSDCYRITVTYTPEKRDFIIDISSRGKEYLSALYNEDGTLKKPVTAYVSAVNNVLPFFMNSQNTYNLLVMRRITGLYNADSFGYTQDFMKFDGTSFTTYYRAVAIS